MACTFRGSAPCSAPDSASASAFALVQLGGLKSAQQKRELFPAHSVFSFIIDLLCNSNVSLLPAFEGRSVSQIIHFIEKVKHINKAFKDKALWDLSSIFLLPALEIYDYQCVS
jgi:hypothetical protein